jgi:hypothetical protein
MIVTGDLENGDCSIGLAFFIFFSAISFLKLHF